MKKGDIIKRILKYKPIEGAPISNGFQVEFLEEKDWIYYDSIVENVYENGFSTTHGEFVDFNDNSIVLK
jgi:hypothetical protein